MADQITGQTIAEQVTKEAVAAAMETPLQDAILDGVDTGRAVPVKESKRIPFAVVFLGVAFSIGYLLGRWSTQ